MSGERKLTRRVALRVLGGSALGAAAACGAGGENDVEREPLVPTLSGLWRRFFREHYREMSRQEVRAMLDRLEQKYTRRYGREVRIDDRPAEQGVLYGFALSVDRCEGYRDCVHACVAENNQSRDPEMQYIRVLELDRGSWKLSGADAYYEHDVPAPGAQYLPVQCFQCENPPCVDVCPVDATWKDADGIVVIDYQRCIGCRYCMTACPYWARRFNWKEPVIPPAELNTSTHYLGNRPRPAGVVEKCTFCVQRVRVGKLPACQEACPTGARVFGNLLDPASEIRYVLENKTVYRLKEELGTEPKFWYFSG